MEDLFDLAPHPGPRGGDAQPQRATDHEPIVVFDILVRGTRETAWQDLFQGFSSLKAITFSASVRAILDVAGLFDDVEITFGSERVLSRELAALEQATSATGYRFTDALADQKAFIERLVRPALSRRGARLLERVQDEQNSERVRINRTSGDLVVDFGGDHNQAARFEKLVPAQALKGRFADAVELDLDALERDFGFAPARRPGRALGAWLARLLGQ